MYKIFGLFIFLFFISSCSLMPPPTSERTFEINNTFREVSVFFKNGEYIAVNISDDIIIKVEYILYNQAYVIEKCIVNGQCESLGDENIYANENILTITNIELY